jgi:hypothetical protein
MATVTETPRPRNPKACYAFLRNVHGIAMLGLDGKVHFKATGPTGMWQELTDADAPHLDLLGRLDLIEVQRIQDERFGSLYALIEYRNTEHARKAA